MKRPDAADLALKVFNLVFDDELKIRPPIKNIGNILYQKVRKSFKRNKLAKLITNSPDIQVKFVEEK